MVIMQEQELAYRCGRNDASAKRELYRKYAPLLLAVCMRYLSERALAEDVLHDSFIKIFASIGKFEWRGEGSLRAYLSKIAANQSLEYLRKNKRITENTFSLDALAVPDRFSADDVEESDIEEIPPAALMSFIEDLPVGYRTIFNMYVMEEKSHGEIAQVLGIKEKTSSSQLLRARKLLAKRIKEYLSGRKEG